MTKIGMIASVGHNRSSTVGPSYDPYARDTRYVELKDGRQFQYVWCSLAGLFVTLRTHHEWGSKYELVPIDDSIPTHDEVARRALRDEAKAFTRAVRYYRGQGFTLRRARGLARDQFFRYEEMDFFIRSQE